MSRRTTVKIRRTTPSCCPAVPVNGPVASGLYAGQEAQPIRSKFTQVSPDAPWTIDATDWLYRRQVDVCNGPQTASWSVCADRVPTGPVDARHSVGVCGDIGSGAIRRLGVCHASRDHQLRTLVWCVCLLAIEPAATMGKADWFLRMKRIFVVCLCQQAVPPNTACPASHTNVSFIHYERVIIWAERQSTWQIAVRTKWKHSDTAN